MASRPSVNGSKNTWLVPFWCCAPITTTPNEDEERLQESSDHDNVRLCFEQPQPIAPPQANPHRPSTSQTVSRHVSQLVASGRDIASRASMSIARPRTAHSRTRPSIGAPMDFRRYSEDLPRQRRLSFRPLELSIYIGDGQLSPLPDFSTSDWERKPAELAYPAQALIRSRDNSPSADPSCFNVRRKPVSYSSHSSISSTTTLTVPCTAVSQSAGPMIPLQSNTIGPGTLHRSRTYSSSNPNVANPQLNPVPSPTRMRSNTEPAPFSPTKVGSVRRPRPDVDEAIRELVTIVEERRADAFRSTSSSPMPSEPPQSPTHHIPVIAPSYKMHVRSETLSDIGSAFSIALPKARPATFEEIDAEFHFTSRSGSSTRSSSRRRPGLLVLPAPPTPTQTTFMESLKTSRSRPTTPSSLSRLTSWLKYSASTPNFHLRSRSGSSASNHSVPLSQVPFYKCNTPHASQQNQSFAPSTTTSLTSLTDSEVPDLVSDDADTDTIADVPTTMNTPRCPSTPGRRAGRKRGSSEVSKLGRGSDIIVREVSEEEEKGIEVGVAF